MIDSHCHLDFPDFAEDLDGVIERAAHAGVSRMITIATRVTEFDRYRLVAERFANVFFTIGTHPHQAHLEPVADPKTLCDLAKHPKCVGLGEAGLDYHYDQAPRALAAEVFRNHIAAARMSGLPLVIHTRDADDDTAAILQDEAAKGAFSAVLHCFTAGRSLASTAVDLGLYISFSGILTFKASDELRRIAADVPLDRLLVETDAPFLAPVPHRGKRNEPAFVTNTAATLAACKAATLNVISDATTTNVERLFGKMTSDAARNAA